MRKLLPLLLRSSFLTLLLLFGLFYCTRGQQTAQFTQYMFNGLAINPAYTGADEALSLTFVNRSQWVSLEGAPTTQTLTAHTLFAKKQLGLGLSLLNDKIGIHKNQKINGSAAYHLNVSKTGILSFGLQAGLNMMKSDYASLKTGSASVDPQLLNMGISKTYFNIGVGFYYRSPKLHLGISIPDLMRQQYTVNDTLTIQWREARYFLFAKYTFDLSENFQLEPGFLIKHNQGLPWSFDINTCLVYKKALTLGLSYRKSESIDFLLKAQLTPQLQFGYSYDYVTGEFNSATRGTHELMVNYIFKYTHTHVTSPR